MAILPISEVETTVPTFPIRTQELIAIGNSSGDESLLVSTATSSTGTKSTQKRSRTRRRRGRGGASSTRLTSSSNSPQQSSYQRPRSNSSGNLSDGDSSSASSTISHSSSSSSSSGSLSSSDNRGDLSRSSKRAHPSTSKTNKLPALSIEEKMQYLAMDCEMVGVGRFGTKSALARVTVVDWDGNTVYDEFVQPTEPVTDYRTFVSGITPDDLEHALDLDTCRAQVQQLIQNKILIGHALKNDLHALNIPHPWQQIRDTAKYEPFMQVRFEDGVLWPRKLKHLAEENLEKQIQLTGQAHSAYEDAVTALELYQKVRSKWEKVMQYKITKTAEIMGGAPTKKQPEQ